MDNDPTLNTRVIDPADDGINFINIYSRSNVTLGRLLSHFSRSQFIHPYFGPFKSMEGFWYYMKSGKKHDELRGLFGKEAKLVGKKFPYVWYDHFKEDILAANYQKIIQNPYLMGMMKSSHLPFEHFYVFGPMKIVIVPPEQEWLTQGMEEIRLALKQDRPSIDWERAEERYRLQAKG